MKWYELSGNESDIVLSTRVRLARNVAGYPFPSRMTPAQAKEFVTRAHDAIQGSAIGASFTRHDFDTMTEADRGIFVEQHAASKELANGKLPRALLLSDDEHISVMVNEEDHLRIQVMGAGLCIDDCLADAEKIDLLMDESRSYAFDERLGYLTACPTNLGCGLRLSVMLHLPALTESGSIRSIIAQASKLGFAVRGIYGEGTQAEGAVYQLSNALSLGRTESETAARLKDVTMRIIETERKLRRKIAETNRMYLENRVYRALGILSNARIMSSQEAIRLLSDLRMGAGVVAPVSTTVIDRLLCEIRPYHVMRSAENTPKDPAARDIARAALIRTHLQ